MKGQARARLLGAFTSLRDLQEQARTKQNELEDLEGALSAVRSAQDDPIVLVLCAQDLVQRLSRVRSEWCRAETAVDQAELEVDRIRALRRRYEEEVDAGLRSRQSA